MSIKRSSIKKNSRGHGVQISLNLLKYNEMTLLQREQEMMYPTLVVSTSVSNQSFFKPRFFVIF